jgi:hypothetical protein
MDPLVELSAKPMEIHISSLLMAKHITGKVSASMC